MFCRIYYVNLANSIDQKLGSINQSSYRLFFCKISNSAQAHLTCTVLCFALSIKGKTLAMFYVAPYAVCVNLLGDQEVVAFTHT